MYLYCLVCQQHSCVHPLHPFFFCNSQPQNRRNHISLILLMSPKCIQSPLLKLIAQCAIVHFYVKNRADQILVTNTIIANIYCTHLVQIPLWRIIVKFTSDFVSDLQNQNASIEHTYLFKELLVLKISDIEVENKCKVEV